MLMLSGLRAGIGDKKKTLLELMQLFLSVPFTILQNPALCTLSFTQLALSLVRYVKFVSVSVAAQAIK